MNRPPNDPSSSAHHHHPQTNNQDELVYADNLTTRTAALDARLEGNIQAIEKESFKKKSWKKPEVRTVVLHENKFVSYDVFKLQRSDPI